MYDIRWKDTIYVRYTLVISLQVSEIIFNERCFLDTTETADIYLMFTSRLKWTQNDPQLHRQSIMSIK